MSSQSLTADQRITKFRIACIKKVPFYGNILLSFSHLREDDKASTLYTDGKSIFYNKEFLESLPEEEANFCLLHELFHIMFLHVSRSRGRDSFIWNIAADIVVNFYISQEMRTLRSVGLQLSIPEGSVPFSAFNVEALTVEQIYDKLVSDKHFSDSLKREKSSLEQPLSGTLQRKAFSATKDLIPSDSLSLDSLETEAISALRTAKNSVEFSGGQAGTMSKGVARFVSAVLDRKLPWNLYLKRWLSASLSDDTSFSFPHRDFLYSKVIVPGPYEEDAFLENVIFAVDTSASIPEQTLARVCSQAKQICSQFECSGKLIFWDTDINSVFDVSQYSSKFFNPVGFGGTSILPLFEYLEKVYYSVCVVFTDGMFPLSKSVPKNVLFVLTSDSRKNDLECAVESSFGSKVLVLECLY